MLKRTGTDGSLLASLPWTLAALAFSLVPHVQDEGVGFRRCHQSKGAARRETGFDIR